ncbi:cyclic nucleotide-gated cation channel beta-1 [Perca fluviatilis]|uniref:cyclic nucleotide-gated cation channel beta-1 n=1 Tax=Perca fluviatilis TaxID=8168 RepID=UPI0019644D6E|nr:cyclic nucleotide-gated cation channel beta-1 [Perca fluviatilis]
MRPSSRQRVAAWLLALSLGRGGEECARRGRLEMISFWLLCWKLLRATAGLGRTTAELTDGNHDNSGSSNNNPVNDSPTAIQPTDPVTMEISSSPPLTHMERENVVSWRSQEVEELHYPEGHGVQQPIRDEQEEEGDAEKQNGKRDEDELDYLVFEIGEKQGEDVGERGEEQGEDGARGDTERGEEQGEDGGRTEIEGKEEGCRETEREDGRRVDTKEEEEWIEETVGELEDNAVSALLVVQSDLSEQAWAQHLGDTDDLSDCLQAELAVVYSDSDAGEDQWASSPPCDVTNQEGADRGIHDSICVGEREEEEKGEEEEEAEVETGREEQREEEVEEEEEKWGGRDDEDEEQSSTASSTDPDRKLPVDFCVPQESYSENVSTEHVDFLLARQQWRKMEEEVKGQPTPKPGLRAQGSFQGTHTSLYPPTRSPRLKHREIHPPVPREPPLSSTLSPSSEDSGLDDLSYRSPLDEPESAVEREIRLTLEREEHHRRERGMITQGLTTPRGSTPQTGRSPPRPPACRTPTLSISPSPSCSSSLPRSVYHEMTANNVIILEPDCSISASRNRLVSSAIGGLSDWSTIKDAVSSANVIVVETSNLIIRSASEFCLSSAPVSMETQESTFSSNPFFKLRSLSSQSLVEQEIRMVRQREEEWRRQREEEWRRQREEMWRRGRERYDTVLVSPGLSDNITYNVPEVSDRCVSSPSSPSRTRKMERSSMSCDHKFPSSLSSVPRRQNAMAQRWEASLLANQKKE